MNKKLLLFLLSVVSIPALATTSSKSIIQKKSATEQVPSASSVTSAAIEIPPLSQRAVIFENMLQQNKGGVVKNDPYLITRRNYFLISGRVDADAGASNRTPSLSLDEKGRFANGSSVDASLTNAFLYGDMKLLNFINVHVTGRYSENHGIYQRFDQDNFFAVPPFDNPYITTDHFSLDEGYIRFNNFNYFPGYVEAGRFYLPFGNYELHPLTETLPQQLSQTQADAVLVGFMEPIGAHGALNKFIYLAHAVHQPINPQSRKENDFGGQIAYQQATESYAYKLGLGVLGNMNDVGLVATTPYSGIGIINAEKRVIGLAFDAVGNAGPFDGHVDFVSALGRFNVQTVAYKDRGAVPKALDVGIGYSFKTFSRDSRIGFSYQHSWQSSGLGLGAVIPGAGLPKHRAQADYIISLCRFMNIQAQVRYDQDYSVADGGTHRGAVTGLLRLTLVGIS